MYSLGLPATCLSLAVGPFSFTQPKQLFVYFRMASIQISFRKFSITKNDAFINMPDQSVTVKTHYTVSKATLAKTQPILFNLARKQQNRKKSRNAARRHILWIFAQHFTIIGPPLDSR